MTFIKINETLYPATISGRVADKDWDNRASKAIKLEMDYTAAKNIFVDGLAWSIVQRNEIPVYGENGGQTDTLVEENEYDNSEYCVAGDLTDHRDGTVTAKMGKPTDSELLAIITGG